jgi:transcriptional regulator with XRE-family HTH domain
MDMGLLATLMVLPVSDAMTPAQCRAARGLLDWTQKELAAAAEVDEATVRDFENEKSAPQTAALLRMRAALAAASCEFTIGRQQGVKLKLLQRGHRVRLRPVTGRQVPTLIIGPRDVATVDEWRHQVGDPPGGRFRLRLASGATTDWLDPTNFERA